MKIKLKLKKRYKNWQYKNTTLLVLSLFLVYLLFKIPEVHVFVHGLSRYGYIGSFITGIFFTSSFTIAPAGYILSIFAQDLPILPLAITAGIGSSVGDIILMSFLRDRIIDELKPLLGRLDRGYARRVFHSPYFFWLMPILGAIIIASPFPDELGISMMGISKIKKIHFFFLTVILNSAGIYLLLSAIRAIV